MKSSTWLYVSLLAVLACCTAAPSRDSESPASEPASTARPDVNESSADSSLPANTESEPPPTAADARVVTAASCAFEYDLSALPDRSWAFDGTLVSLGTLLDSQLGTVPAARFLVNHWYRGGSRSEVTVQFEMGTMSEFVPNTDIGARLLVTGEPRWGEQPLADPVAWSCGFTQPWTAEAADSWASALG